MTRARHVLVLYGTDHGHTAKIAERIGRGLDAAGCISEFRDAELHDPDPLAYDAIVVAASVHGGKYQRKVVEWVRRNSEALTSKPNAFVSSSLTAAEPGPHADETVQELIGNFTARTGWTPDRTKSVAGCLQFREYGFVLRLFMKWLMAKGHHTTDTSQDHEFTDWDEVDAFAAILAEDFSDADAAATLAGSAA